MWKHCSGIDNPADLPSRGAEFSMLIDDPLWLNGSKWLCDINPTEDCELPPETAVLEECMFPVPQPTHSAIHRHLLDVVLHSYNHVHVQCVRMNFIDYS